MGVWCYADLWESIAQAVPDRAAILQGDTQLTWRALNDQANALARHLLRQGVGHQGKVGIYMPNRPEYLITQYAAFKASLVPFNVNYRYSEAELVYLFDNADAEVVVFDAAYADRLAAIRAQLPKVRIWIVVHGSTTQALPVWADDFDAVASCVVPENIQGPRGRSGDDAMFIYTGGTTGMPKGVVWRQEDALGVHNFGSNPALGLPALTAPEEAGLRAARTADLAPTTLITCPLMHGTGLMSAVGAFLLGGAAVLLEGGSFDAEAIWGAVEQHRAQRMTIVGLAFASPLLDALKANPCRWDLSSLRIIGSAGAMWSQENKREMMTHLPGVQMADAFGSSEAFGLGASVSAGDKAEGTARFALGARAAVFTEDGRRVKPGSGERGFIAVTGPIPLGYYKDEAKTAQTFRMFEGKRWSVPGDWAELAADGSLKLLGRGSQSINTGGEKVFPEEVEEALKRHAAVNDAAVVGMPDPRFGERVCAIVQLRRGAPEPDLAELSQFVKEQIAPYKAPRDLVVVEDIGRAPNGKLDYRALKERARSSLLSSATAAT